MKCTDRKRASKVCPAVVWTRAQVFSGCLLSLILGCASESADSRASASPSGEGGPYVEGGESGLLSSARASAQEAAKLGVGPAREAAYGDAVNQYTRIIEGYGDVLNSDQLIVVYGGRADAATFTDPSLAVSDMLRVAELQGVEHVNPIQVSRNALLLETRGKREFALDYLIQLERRLGFDINHATFMVQWPELDR